MAPGILTGLVWHQDHTVTLEWDLPFSVGHMDNMTRNQAAELAEVHGLVGVSGLYTLNTRWVKG